MEKIIQICQKFELNIDDLLNKDIREVKGEQESKNNINKFIEDSLHYITDSVNLFSNMSFKTKIKCIFEQLFIMGILAIVLLIIGGICVRFLQLFLEIFYQIVFIIKFMVYFQDSL